MADFRIGVVAGCLKQPDPAAAAAAARQVGANCLQVSNRRPAGMSVLQWAAAWRTAAADGEAPIASAVTGFAQEDYSSIAAIHRTGGLLPDDALDANIRQVIDALDFAKAVGAPLLTFHAGFIPDDAADPAFAKMVERIRRCADEAAGRGLRIGLESGQESAAALKRFLHAVGRVNVGCNFDPANMILYGRQAPLEAVDVLAENILQVHAKDGLWSSQPGVEWGRETPVGQGAVDFRRFLAKLRRAGFRGDLIVEREAGQSPLSDIAESIRYLRALAGS